MPKNNKEQVMRQIVKKIKEIKVVILDRDLPYKMTAQSVVAIIFHKI